MDEMITTPSDAEIRKTILLLTSQRGGGRTICPSEVARALRAENWRPLMPDVRRVAAQLIESNHLVAKQQGQVVQIETARGPIRLCRKN